MENAWKEIRTMEKVVSPIKSRHTRQTGLCRCNANSGCPSGPKGSPGDPGVDG